jgi:two-component system phosphate regulon sensor histidine kinase PhoR
MARDVTAANRLTRMRRDFVTNLSHEIKTPLAIIRGAAETLEEAGPGDAVAAGRFVRRIVEQIYRMEDLLKDLLTLSRLESPEASRHRLPCDLAAISHRAIELLAPLAGRAQVTLRAEIEPVPTLAGDGKALERLVLNLVVNAIQYNREGGHVTLRLHPRANSIVLEVEDDGVGIPAADVPRIFERFYRVDKGRGRAEGGSGLGLAIVKHVVQAHGGTLEVKTEIDRGSMFSVVLPVAPPERENGDADEARTDVDPVRRREGSLVVAG